MSTQDVRQPAKQEPKRTVKDLPGCIKYILLLFLILLLLAEIYAGEFRSFPDWSGLVWIILLIKLFLIGLLLWLIRVQRQLNCALTEPNICAIAEYDATLHKWVIHVRGTASGTAFSNYTLSVTRGGLPYPVPIIYPGGASSGTVPVINGELGLLDVTDIESDAYAVKLTVNPTWGSPCIHENSFDILRKTVSITDIGGVPAQVMGPHPSDPTEPLKLVKATPDPVSPTSPEASVGGSVNVRGTADYDGCGRQMSEYVLQRKQVAFGDDPWQQDAPDPWVVINGPLPFGDATHPRVYNSFWGLIDNFVRTPNILTRRWAFRQILQAIWPSVIYDGKWITEGQAWVTGVEGDPAALNGRHTVRVRVQHQPIIGPPDPTPPELYDAATVWIDNRKIVVDLRKLKITGGGSLDVCQELSLSAFLPTGNADIIGQAWDPIILDPPAATPIEKPNDNFGSYGLSLLKAGGGYVTIPIGGPAPIAPDVRVPNVLQVAPPPPLDTDVLTVWGIVNFLDAGNAPSPYVAPPYPKIYRGERCAYNIQLGATDTTVVNEGTTHNNEDDFPFCIMNDLSPALPFPAV